VLTFSFTSRELRADPWAGLRDNLEQLDIKYTAEFDIALTTHVVAKKRNTPKGLQALINGKYVVIESFIAAIIEAATVPGGVEPGAPSPLEQDFDAHWPNSLAHLPPRGEEPVDRPVDAYAPDERRKEIFDGYTFIFYDKTQYENLFPPISLGKGKALLKTVVPEETELDEFVRYVKEVAGEKGLGEFEDGSEGKGVVVVRYLPAKGDHVQWFAKFYEAVSLRLDHRLIDQKDFLDAIVAVEPEKLRQPLPSATQPPSSPIQSRTVPTSSTMDVDQPDLSEARTEGAVPTPPRRVRPGRAVTSRFKGFDLDDDSDEEMPARPPSSTAAQLEVQAQEEMFVSQNDGQEAEPEPVAARTSQRKRPARSPIRRQETMMKSIAPTAAAVKRRRIAAGEDPVPSRRESPEAELEGSEAGSPAKGSKAKPNGEIDVLEAARRNREEQDKRAAAERERLADAGRGDIDAEEIRRLTIVEEMEVRRPSALHRRDQDGADSRWDPRWNGRRNFKKFRKQGDPVGRAMPRVIVPLEEVKPKEYGIGDDYWLEDESQRRRKKSSGGRGNTMSQSQTVEQAPQTSKGKGKAGSSARRAVESDSEEEEEVGQNEGEGEDTSLRIDTIPQTVEEDMPRSRTGKAAQRANARVSQTQSQVQSQRSANKRAAADAPAREKAAKKPRRVVEIQDSDDSDEDGGLRFKFGKR